MIFALYDYVNEHGHCIQQKVPLIGTEIPYTEFTGRIVIVIDTPRGQVKRPIEFPISAANITEAYGQFTEKADAAVELIKQQMNKPKIALPGE